MGIVLFASAVSIILIEALIRFNFGRALFSKRGEKVDIEINREGFELSCAGQSYEFGWNEVDLKRAREGVFIAAPFEGESQKFLYLDNWVISAEGRRLLDEIK